MDTAIIIITAGVVVAGLTLLYFTWKMILTGDYSMFLNEAKKPGTANIAKRQPHRGARNLGEHVRNSVASSERLSSVHGLDLAVEHFVQDLPEWNTPADRRRGSEELNEIFDHACDN